METFIFYENALCECIYFKKMHCVSAFLLLLLSNLYRNRNGTADCEL